MNFSMLSEEAIVHIQTQDFVICCMSYSFSVLLVSGVKKAVYHNLTAYTGKYGSYIVFSYDREPFKF